ncbi:NAD(P)-binding Rossmann-fold superfamily protein [Actinidia rufa]|uniref:NAD(P)-binding Rossmann-fold superfamily protein n=1 Tax=Actinidia rufa TaxID=165716 RepID=A0A7J0GIC4_9ERIC|nr:NAD(P)-binding Rossmann-fold superfamily protein [Actinidia rufa]
METVELKVEMVGMHEKRVRKCLSKLKGIEKVEVDANCQKVVVTGYAHRNKILKAVRRGGLKADFWGKSNFHLSENEGIEGKTGGATGGVGFVGSALCFELLRRGAHQVRAIFLQTTSPGPTISSTTTSTAFEGITPANKMFKEHYVGQIVFFTLLRMACPEKKCSNMAVSMCSEEQWEAFQEEECKSLYLCNSSSCYPWIRRGETPPSDYKSCKVRLGYALLLFSKSEGGAWLGPCGESSRGHGCNHIILAREEMEKFGWAYNLCMAVFCNWNDFAICCCIWARLWTRVIDKRLQSLILSVYVGSKDGFHFYYSSSYW